MAETKKIKRKDCLFLASELGNFCKEKTTIKVQIRARKTLKPLLEEVEDFTLLRNSKMKEYGVERAQTKEEKENNSPLVYDIKEEHQEAWKSEIEEALSEEIAVEMYLSLEDIENIETERDYPQLIEFFI